ncbi:unannotated protein [freshwater metagenome]|uniref:Unannotated protein n=1 Tax=freshwater metagenome TaxID=449393 RepID=A0A6J7IME4_9ZZZZ|nr:hypothetical protein [Actinomycetota bacterium]
MTDVRGEPGAIWVEIVQLEPGPASSRVPHPVAVAADASLGAAAGVARLGIAASLASWRAAESAGRMLRALPGASAVGRMGEAALEPLTRDGRRVRALAPAAATDALQAVLELVVARVVRAADIDAIVRRIDVDAIVDRIDIERILERIDVDELIGRVDVDAIVDRIDVNEIVDRVDIEAIIEETRIGTIVARSTSGFASEALDVAREQTANVDGLTARVVNRLLRRDAADLPVGPPLLVGDDEPVSPADAGA